MSYRTAFTATGIDYRKINRVKKERLRDDCRRLDGLESYFALRVLNGEEEKHFCNNSNTTLNMLWPPGGQKVKKNIKYSVYK
jgi:hypothetical protein